MSEISNVLPPSLTELPPVSNKPKEAMGKDDFMKLLMVQLQNQDPLKPMDHEQFSAQLAQFSSLEQLANIGKGIEGLHTGLGDGAKLQAVSMIGKRISAVGNEVTLMKGENVSIRNNLPEGSKPTSVAIFSPGGQVVREMQLDPKTGNEIVWDGKDDSGAPLPSGKYTFRLHGVNSAGQSQEGSAEMSGLVTGVEMNGRNAVLLVQTASGKSKVEMNKVGSVNLDAEAPAKTPVNAMGMPIGTPSLPGVPGAPGAVSIGLPPNLQPAPAAPAPASAPVLDTAPPEEPPVGESAETDDEMGRSQLIADAPWENLMDGSRMGPLAGFKP
jgi:flagellar basal-body rod modification protein FlgD